MTTAAASLGRFFAQAADDAEGTIHRIRVVVLVLVFVRLLGIAWDELLAGRVKHWITAGAIVVGITSSWALLRAIRSSTRKAPLQVLSAVLDAALAFTIVLPSVVWARPAYVGVVDAPDFGIWMLVACSAGLRLSWAAAVAGPLAASFALAALIGIDLQLNADTVRYGVSEVVMAGVLMVAATLLAQALYRWIGELVRRASGETERAERARQRLGAYVSEEVAELALASEGEQVMGGTQQPVAVLFSDLRGFTRTGEELGPDALIEQLNAYLDAMVQAIDEHGGVVDKYMGDAILAVFGIPRRRGDEATRAIRTALRMQELLDGHNRERASRGQKALQHGIGVHYGLVVAGHVGTRSRLQYTVIGDPVNVASRLQTATKDVGEPVLLSEAVVARARTEGAELPRLRALEPLSLRGRTGAIPVHTLAGP